VSDLQKMVDHALAQSDNTLAPRIFERYGGPRSSYDNHTKAHGVHRAVALLIELYQRGLFSGNRGLGLELHIKGRGLTVKVLEPKLED
jgi:hypothetical protein